MKFLFVLIFVLSNIIYAESVISVCDTNVTVSSSFKNLNWKKFKKRDRHKLFKKINGKKCLAISNKKNKFLSIIEKEDIFILPKDIDSSNLYKSIIVYRNKVGIYKKKALDNDKLFNVFFKSKYPNISQVIIYSKFNNYEMLNSFKCSNLSKNCKHLKSYKINEITNKNQW